MLVVVLAAVLLSAGAAAQPVRLWDTPTANDESPTGTGQPPTAVSTPSEQRERDSQTGDGAATLLQALAVVAAATGVVALMAMRGSWPDQWTRAGSRSRQTRRVGTLPTTPDDDAIVSVEQARIALSTGQPRSAIVACWMQLERDIAAAGWPRRQSETSAEYVERILGEVSVDPQAIGDLAALYREARFSDHALLDTDRARAHEALARVDLGLRARVRVSA